MGSFSKAAENLYISQPSLSAQVKSLEQEAGGALFIRGSKRDPVRPTSLGLIFLDHATRILHEEELLQASLKEELEGIQGSLALGLFWTFETSCIPAMLAAFTQQYPGTRLDIEISGTQTLIKRLNASRLDSAFVFYDPQVHKISEQFNVWPICQSDIGIVLSHKHPLSGKQILRIDDLAEQQCILPDSESSLYTRVCHEMKRRHVSLKVVGMHSTSSAVIGVAVANLACGFVSKEAFDRYGTDEVNWIKFVPTFQRNISYICNPSATNMRSSSLLRKFVTEYRDTHHQ